jgi:hypothetical protein
MGRVFLLVSYAGLLILALLILTAILALAGVDRFDPPVANPPT